MLRPPFSSVSRALHCGVLLLTVSGAQPALMAAREPIGAREKTAEGATMGEPVASLLEQSGRLAESDPGGALDLARQAEAIARDPRDTLFAIAAQAALHRQRTDYSEALLLGRKGLEEAVALGDDRLRARFSHVLARTFWSLADYPKSIEYFHEAIHLGQKLGDIALLCDAHTGIITNYTELRDHAQAEFHLAEAGKYAEQLGDPSRLGDFLKVLGNHLDNVGDHAGARAAHERSLRTHEAAGNDRGTADALQNLGYIIEAEGDLAAAEGNFLRAIGIYERLGLPRHLANAHRQLGRVLVKQRRFAEGLANLERSLALAREFNGGVAMANAYRQLAIAHQAAGDLTKALDYQHELQRATDAIFGEKSRQQIAVLDARFEAERRQHEIDLLRRDQALKNAEIARIRWQRLGLIAVFGLGVVAVSALVSRQRLKLAAERRVRAESESARLAAEQANAFKTRLVGIASHDLKAPLRGIVAGAGQLADAPGNAAEVAALARRMETQGRRMFGLIRDLLDLAALEAGRLELQCAPLSPAALAREVTDSLQPQAIAKRQTLECTVEPGAEQARVNADEARLRQTLENLVDNALKFTPPARKVRVRVRTETNTVRLDVADEGPGLAPEDYGRLFQPFGKLSAAPTGDEPSNGLGLFIVRELVNAHGGQLVVDSMPGQGATFTVMLPALAEEPDGAARGEIA